MVDFIYLLEDSVHLPQKFIFVVRNKHVQVDSVLPARHERFAVVATTKEKKEKKKPKSRNNPPYT